MEGIPTILADVEASFARGDLSRLVQLAPALKRSGKADSEAARCYRLIGDLHRKRRDFRRAVAAYRESITHERSNGAVYGLLESLAALSARQDFAAQLEEFVARAKYDENIWSRLMLAAARLKLRAAFDTLAATARVASAASEDAYFWFRFAKALALLGDREEAGRLARRAASLSPENSELAVEIATIEYDMRNYWDLRYAGDPHAPVPPSSRDARAYDRRTARDTAYLESLFRRLFAAKPERVADCGCGSGRLTTFLTLWSGSLDCYDISANAIAFAKAEHRHLPEVGFFHRDLSAEALPEGRYDLVFDFTVVQHVANTEKWENVLDNYRRGSASGGSVLLVEQSGGPRGMRELHLSHASQTRYVQSFAREGFACRLKERTPWGETAMCFAREA